MKVLSKFSLSFKHKPFAGKDNGLFCRQIKYFHQNSGKDLISYLNSRLSFFQCSSADFEIQKDDKVYIGFDPTAEKLHIGSLIGIVNALRCIGFGMEPVFVIGGATALIGDPTGKKKERPQLEKEQIERNIESIKNIITNLAQSIITSENYKKFLSQHNIDRSRVSYSVINNADFYSEMNIIYFLREIGTKMRMGPMLSRETIKNRINSEEGLTLTEFMYQSVQGYDYLKLNKDYNVKLQLGGSDQWGNMVSGMELIKQVSNTKSVNILTHPLLTTACGQKLGKSEGNAVFMCDVNPNLMYQYLLNLSDDNVEPLLYKLTFIPNEEVNEIVLRHKEKPEKRLGQKTLAEVILKKFCCEDKVKEVIFQSENMFCNEMNNDFFQNCSKIKLEKTVVQNNSLMLSDLLKSHNLVISKNKMRKLIETKSLKINNNFVESDKQLFQEDFFNGEYLMVQTSKTKRHVFHLV